MTAPNLRSPATVTGKTALAALTTSLASVLPNGASSNKVLKVNTIRAANIGSAAVTVDIAVVRSANTRYLIKDASIDAGKALIISNKDEYIYLEEGDDLQAKASAVTSADLSIHYEEIS